MVLKEKGHCVRRALKLPPRQSICLRNSSVITDWVVADFCVASPQVHSVLAYFSSETADPVPRQGRERGLSPIPLFSISHGLSLYIQIMLLMPAVYIPTGSLRNIKQQ